MRNKFLSRKFLISLAAFLGSIGASIYGLATDNKTVAAIGIVCSILSTAIYTACEAYVDAQAATKKRININDEAPKE